MIYILYKSLEITNKLESNEDRLLNFKDNRDIFSYAIKGADYLLNRDIISDSENIIKAKALLTRAEVAQTLYNLLIKINK